MNIAVFASHGGSDLQAIIDGCKSNKIGANVSVVISNNGSSMALQRANNEGIPSYHLSAKKFGSEELLAEEILEVLSKYQIDMIFLAGYMRMLHISILEKYNEGYDKEVFEDIVFVPTSDDDIGTIHFV